MARQPGTDRVINTAAESFRLLQEASLRKVPLNWREFLSLDPYMAPVQVPEKGLLPQTTLEREWWLEWLAEGLFEGRVQARRLFLYRLAQLEQAILGRLNWLSLKAGGHTEGPELTVSPPTTRIDPERREVDIGFRTHSLRQLGRITLPRSRRPHVKVIANDEVTDDKANSSYGSVRLIQ